VIGLSSGLINVSVIDVKKTSQKKIKNVKNVKNVTKIKKKRLEGVT